MKRLILLLLGGLACGPISDAAAATDRSVIIAGPITNPANRRIYYLLAQNTWKGSQAEATILGGDLVTIKDAAENQWVFDTFSEYGGKNRILWIGLTDAAQTGTFKWIDGEPVTYLNWGAGEPNEIGREHFVYMFPKDGPDPIGQPPGRWNNFQDSATQWHYSAPIYGVMKLRPVRSMSLSRMLAGIGIWEIVLVLGVFSIFLTVIGGIIFLVVRYSKTQSNTRVGPSSQ